MNPGHMANLAENLEFCNRQIHVVNNQSSLSGIIPLGFLLLPSFRAYYPYNAFSVLFQKLSYLLVGCLSLLCGRMEIYIYRERRRMLPIAALRLGNGAGTGFISG
ncbi:uncharacterized [Tachysurus ichikawai]